MARTEYECRILNIDLDEFLSKLESLEAEDKGEKLQRRFIYDFDPVDPDKWIRLRTNGDVTTLAIKKLKRTDEIGNADEEEVEVGDLDTMDRILQQLGYKHRNYQENKRHSFKIGNVSIDIDTWPRIPTYVEVEGSSEDEVLYALYLLGVDLSQTTTKDVTTIYSDYGIDIKSIKELRFDEDMLEPHQSM